MMYCPKCGVKNPDDARFCSGCGSQLGAEVAVISEKASTYYAGFWKRFAAAIIDHSLLGIGGSIINAIPVVISGIMGEEMPIAITVWFGAISGLVLYWLYFTLLESSSRQATLGKMALRIVVTDLKGNKISFGRANARYWGKFVSGAVLLIGYIMAGLTEKKQALHDIMADTLVVKK